MLLTSWESDFAAKPVYSMSLLCYPVEVQCDRAVMCRRGGLRFWICFDAFAVPRVPVPVMILQGRVSRESESAGRLVSIQCILSLAPSSRRRRASFQALMYYVSRIPDYELTLFACLLYCKT